MKPLLLLSFLLVACQPVQELRQRLNTWRNGQATEVPATPDQAPPVSLPPLEEDKVIQFTPKDKIISLIEQFNRAPDAGVLELVIEDLGKQRTLLGKTRDTVFISALNGTVPHLQTQEPLAVQFLVRLLPLLDGENLRHVKIMVGRALDYAPVIALGALAKTAPDQSCALVVMVPDDIVPENKTDFLDNRRTQLESARVALAQNPAALNHLDACMRQLQLVLPPPAPPEVLDLRDDSGP